MIWIVLAAGLGVANWIMVALLFRRERNLSRQLSDMRAERNSEWILHALRSVPEQREQAAKAANGDIEPLPTGPQPVRRKGHLGLFLGGLAAIVAAFSRTWQKRRGPITGGLVGATVATAATVLAVTSGPGTHHRPPSSAPTATATITSTPGHPPPAPSAKPAPTGSPSAPNSGPQPSASSTATAVTPINRLTPPSPTTGGGTLETGTAAPPGQGGPPPTLTEPPPMSSGPPTRTPTPVDKGLCLSLLVTPLPGVYLCPLGGG